MASNDHSFDNKVTSTGDTWRYLLTQERWIEIGRILLTGILIFLYWRAIAPLPVLLAAVVFGLYPLAKTGLETLVKKRLIGTEIFVILATVIAMIGHEYVAGAVMMVIILIAEFIADLNTDRARASIDALIGAVPQVALVRGKERDQTVPLAELKVGDVVLARAGEKIPVDGVVVGGQGSVNEATITGESLPQEKEVGTPVFAGTIVESGALDVKTLKLGKDTMVARIIELVEQAEEQQAPAQKLADRVAAWLIPVVLVFLAVVFLVTKDVRKIVTLLIFTSPAELGLATPLVMIAAIARAARSGILIKGGLYLEILAKVDGIVFDKTGTLTVGEPEVVRVVSHVSALSEADVVRLAAAADKRSGHPLAKAVVAHAERLKLEVPEPAQFEDMRGRGVRATIDGKRLLVGNEALLDENGIKKPVVLGYRGYSSIHVALDGQAIGTLYLADRPRPGAKEAVARLKASGVKHVVMLTGDNIETARRVADELGVDAVQAGLLPEDKVKAISSCRARGHRVAMVGDGINDAPALAQADVGIAMGARGTQAAIEAADIALMTDDLAKIGLARAIARRAYRTIKENLLLGGLVHTAGIAAALAGLIGPIEAALLHVVPDTLIFLNSVKLLRVRIKA